MIRPSLARYEEAEPLILSGYANLDLLLPNINEAWTIGWPWSSLLTRSAARSRISRADDERTIEAAKLLVRLYEAMQKPEQAETYRKMLPPACTSGK
jgi:hypothetical protein